MKRAPFVALALFSGKADVMTNELVFSSSPEFADAALEEIRRMLPGAQLKGWLEPGVGVVASVPCPFSQVVDRLDAQRALFVRHLFPVSLRLTLSPAAVNLSALTEGAAALCSGFLPDLPFSVQVRTKPEIAFSVSRREMAEALATPFVEAGNTLDVRSPQQVLSVYCSSDTAFLGVSTVLENRSAWPGGEHRFAWEQGQICRAEFKLLEALEVFGVHVPTRGTALDLGASPGGWTRVLRRRGLDVVAVDPGELHPSLQSDRKVEHFRGTVQRFVKDLQEGRRRRTFDLLVNDMRMVVGESVEMTRLASLLLKEKGVVLMTLKLPPKKPVEAARRALETLSRDFRLLGARHLFHNRHEVTVLLQKDKEK